MSGACGAAAAKLALHKTPEEITDIDHVVIEQEVGGLPEEDLHCATLAAGTLQEVVRLYFVEDESQSLLAGNAKTFIRETNSAAESAE
jgi:nitrogen fixation protein NifU and related proteins